jgi:hypothetical protein
VRPTISDLDRLIRLEEFLREETTKAQALKVVPWCDGDESEEVEIPDKCDASPAATDEED